MRIHWPNRTVVSERRLQNSTNNLINRQEHRVYFMLAWHTTGAHGMRANEVRSFVLARVAAAQPPLPPNSTRGLTPGLINPLLGNIPGNRIPQPIRRINQGRLRVTGRPIVTHAAAVAAANQPLPNTAQAYPVQTNSLQLNQPQALPIQNSQGRNNRGRDNLVRNKRRRTSRESKGRQPKRQAQDSNDDIEDDKMDTGSEGNKSSDV